MTASARLKDSHLAIVRFCAIECELQRSGERSVWRMLEAWAYAQGRKQRRPTEADVLILGALIEPAKNDLNHYRTVGVRVGWDVKPDWRTVPDAMERLIAAVPHENADEWFRRYEEIHPFIDGNGRSGVCLFNWLSGTLDAPTWPPNFWNDPRRTSGDGAP